MKSIEEMVRTPQQVDAATQLWMAHGLCVPSATKLSKQLVIYPGNLR